MKKKKYLFAMAFVIALLSFASQTYAFHSNFLNNANNCNYCHSLHASKKDMLLTDAVATDGTSTCMGCHDSTTKSYGVKSHNLNAGTMTALVGPSTGDTSATYPGGSAHNVGIGKTSSQAPGANHAGTTNGWGDSFGCTSCHNGHQSLGAAPNVAMLKFQQISTSDAKATDFTQTKATDSYDVVTTVPTTKTTKYVFVATKVRTDNWVDTSGRTKYGSFYSKYMQNLALKYSLTSGASYVLIPYIWVPGLPTSATTNGGYVSVNPAISGTVTGITGVSVAPEGFLYGSIDSTTTGSINGLTLTFTVNPFRYGADLKGSDDTALGNYTNGLGESNSVANKVDNSSYWDVVSTNYINGVGNSLSLFCLQCHTDYMSKSHGTNATNYDTSTGYRHTNINASSLDGTSGDRLSCTRCHFAHGTDYAMMRDSVGYNAATLPKDGSITDANTRKPVTTNAGNDAKTYFTDPNTTSSMKRQPGFSVCLQCHGTAVGNASNADYKSNMGNAPF